MADFEEALQALLADPAAMGQIMTLAQTLGAAPPAEEDSGSSPVTTPDTLPQKPESDSGGPVEASPASAGPESAEMPDFSFPDLGDLGQLTRLMGLFQAGSSALDPEAAALIQALRPFLRPERQRKLDRALRLAALSQTLRAAYALWKEGDSPV